MAKVLGVVDVIWKGRNIPVEKGATLRLGGMKNNAVTYGRRVDRAQEFQGSEITAKTHLRQGQSARDIFDEGEGELQVHCDTGQVFTFPEAFLVDDRPTMTAGEGGSIELKWAAGEWEEVISA